MNIKIYQSSIYARFICFQCLGRILAFHAKNEHKFFVVQI